MAKHKQDDVIANFRLVKLLGKGGFGEVWKAEHTGISGKFEAFKFPLKSEYLEFFRKEASVLNSLSHPSIVEITDLALDGENPYIRMEYIEADTLEQTLQKNKKIPWQQSVDIVYKIAEALGVIHQKNIIHGDLKPSNIFICNDNNIKVVDFGLGIKRNDDGESFALSGCFDEKVAGTWDYMAPEQKQGKLVCASDIYTLGVIWYEMIAGKKPTALELPSHFAPGCPSWIDTMIRRMLLPVEERDQDVYGIMKDLKQPPRADNFGHQLLFICGIFCLILSWFSMRAFPVMLFLLVLGFILIEIARSHIPTFWPALFFWVGILLTLIMYQIKFFFPIGLLFAAAGGMWWLTVKK